MMPKGIVPKHPRPEWHPARRCRICGVAKGTLLVVGPRPGQGRALVCESCRDLFRVAADRILGEIAAAVPIVESEVESVPEM